MKKSCYQFLVGLCWLLSFWNTDYAWCQVNGSVDSTSFYQDKIKNPQSDKDLIDSYEFFNREYYKHIQLEDSLSAIKSLKFVAEIENNLGLNQQSETTSVNALKILDKLSESKETKALKSSFYNLLGRTYRINFDPKMSLVYYQKALDLTGELRESLSIRNNMANVYVEGGDFKMADSIFELVNKDVGKTKDTLLMALTLDNWGYASSRLGNPEGLDRMKKALEMRKAHGDQKGIYVSYYHLSYYYEFLGDLNKAKNYADSAYVHALKFKSPFLKKDAMYRLMQLVDDPLVTSYMSLTDSLNQHELEVKNEFSARQYNFFQEKRRADRMELQNEIEKNKRNISIALIVFILILGLVVYYFIRQKHQKDKIREVLTTEAHLSKRVHDEIANDVHLLMSRLQFDTDANIPVILDKLDVIYEKSRDISREHSIFLMDENIEVQFRDLINSYNSPKVNVLTRNLDVLEGIGKPKIYYTILYRVLQELLVNMKKHSNATLVVIKFSKSKGKLIMEYIDNGIGCELKNTHGLEIVRNKIQSIQGSMQLNTSPGNGFKVVIKI